MLKRRKKEMPRMKMILGNLKNNDTEVLTLLTVQLRETSG
jgi:hypothetical protein